MTAQQHLDPPAPPRVSVVLATYQGAEFLGTQLESLQRLDPAPDEFVIVDDASSDDTPALLRAFAERSTVPVTLMLRDEHLGTWATFDEGLRAATGDLLVICDQDDRWHRNKIGVLLAAMADRPDALMAFSDARLIDADGRLIGRSRWRVAGFTPPHVQMVALDPFGQLLSHQAVSGCTMAVRAELLPVMLPFPDDIHPGLPRMMYDRWMSLLAACAAPVVTVPERLIDYRIHRGQQIGIPALPIRRVLPRSALFGAQFLHGQGEVRRRMQYHVAHLDEIEKRLEASMLDRPEALARLRAARAHLVLRSSLDRKRRQRIRPVAEELRRIDGYRRFSFGVVSAAADVVR
jgi:hypothetical protein